MDTGFDIAIAGVMAPTLLGEIEMGRGPNGYRNRNLQ
jgi:hypothetical protein